MPRQEDSDKKLFVGGLSYDTDNNNLKEYFERYGPLSDYIVMRFPDSQRSRGFGFVTFEGKGSLEDCFSAQPHTLDGRTVELKRAQPREETGRGGGGGGGGRRGGQEEENDPESKAMRKLFIGGLNYNTTEQGMKSYFEKFGDLEDAVIMKFPDSGRSRGFGFITYSRASMVDECQQSRPHEIDGKEVECKRATPRSSAKSPEAQASVKKLFISNLTEEMSDADLRNYFSKFGNVTVVEQMKWNDTGKKRGFGFIEFDDYDAVDKICLLGAHVLMGKRLEVKKALSKQEMSMLKKAKMTEDWNRGSSNYNDMAGMGGNMGGRGMGGGGGGGNMGRGGMGGGMGGGGNMGNGGGGMGNMGGNMGGMGGNMGNMGGNMGGGMGGGNMGGGMGGNMGGNMGGMGGGGGNMGGGGNDQSGMNPMMMMNMMMTMMNGMQGSSGGGGNPSNAMQQMMNMMSGSGGGGNMGGSSGGAAEIKKEPAQKQRGFGEAGASSGYNAAAYNSSGYSTNTGSAAGTTTGGYGGGYGSNSGYGGGQTGGASTDMMGMGGGGGNNWGNTAGWGNSSGGGPVRGSGNNSRDGGAPYQRR